MDPKTVLLLALVAGANAVPIDVSRFNEDTSCAKSCSGSVKFSYESGKTYEFLYETETRTGIEGAAEDKSSLLMMANVHVEVMSPCEFVLKITDARLLEIDPAHPSRQVFSPKNREFKRSLEANALRFGFQNGRIESVCPNDGDPLWILNIKRGVLSTFQNVMDSLDRDQRVTETDVAGECDAEYKVTKPPTAWSSHTVVKKTKNLMGCRNRHGYNSAIQAIPYNVQSEVQSLPLMKSRHDCEQEIEGGRLITATCKESHVFRPFSKGSNGAATETTQKLKFKTEKSNVKSTPDFVGRRSDLRFEHSQTDGADKSDPKSAAVERLQKLCELTKDDIRPETPQLFADLVHILRDLDADSLRDLYHRVKDRSFCSGNEERTRKFFMDAIPMVGTKASVGMIENLISKGIVEGIESDIWVTSLAFIANPTREMVSEVKPLLRSKPTGHVMLSVSALVNNYCRVKPCENDIEVEEIVSILEENLGYQCDIRGNDAEKILLSLRAIGNTGHAQKAVPTLNRCFAKDDLPMEIRLSAVNAFRHMSCKADLNNIMLLFRNKEEDSELRIAAYLSVIECPTQWVLDQIKETLESEEVNQVGSFVWSHLTNLMETSDPHKQAIRAILEDETLAKEFDMDKRKFSRNYEGSVFFEKLNTGAKAESNIIWSSKSFLPRSAMVNLTVDLFGHAINLVEIGGRVEGLESYLESLFGPEGFLKNPGAKESWKRSKRQVVRRDKLERIKQRYGISSDEVAGSIYLRMFGNELQYISMGGPGKTKKPTLNVMDMLLKLARQNSYQVTQNMMFMDSTIVIPTSVGIPLKLTVNGTATVDLKVSGKMDVRKATSRPSNMHIEGVVQPSGAVEVASTMVVDAFLVRSGLKMVTTLHSSTAANGKLEVKNGQVLNVEFDTPREKMEIINMNTRFFVLHREAEREQKMIDVDRKLKTACSGEKLAKLTGMEICGSIGFSNASSKDEAPYFPLTGPISMDINLFKRDTHSGYIFSAKYSSDTHRKSARVSFNTPGSRYNRQLVTDVELNLKDKDLEMNLVTPWKKASVKGSLENGDDLKRASLRVVVDRQKEYNVNGEVKISGTDKRIKYIPLLEISAPSMKTITVGGAIEKVGDEGLELDISMQNVLRNPVNIRSTAVNNDKQKSLSGSLSNGKEIYTAEYKLLIKSEKKSSGYNATINMRCPRGQLISAEASFDKNPKKREVRLFIDKVVKNPIKLEGSIGNSQTKRSNKHTLKMDIETPLISLDVNGLVDKKKGKKSILMSKATVNYQLPNKIRDRVTVSSKIRNLSTQSLSKYDIDLNANFKKNRDLNFESSANLELSSTNMDSSLELQYGDNPKNEDKKITFTQSASNRLKGGKRISNMKVNLVYPAKDIAFQIKGTHLHTGSELDSNIMIRPSADKEISANVKLSDNMRRKNTMSGEIGVSYPGRRLRATTELRKINDKEYNNTIDLIWGKGGKAKIETTYKRPSRLVYEATSAIHVPRGEQVTLSGSVNLDSKDFKGSLGAVRGKDKYQVALAHKVGLKSYDGELDVLYNRRHIIADVGADWRNKYSGKVDVKWDADNNKNERLKADGDLDINGIRNVRGSINGQIRNRKVMANIRHQSKDKHTSHLDVTYAPGKVIQLDTTFNDDKSWSSRKIEGSLRLTSPCRWARFIDINAEHSVDKLQFETVADVAWSRSEKIAGTLTIKRPVSLKKVETSLSISTPFPEYRKISAEINHRAESDLLTSVKAEAGRHNIDARLVASNRGLGNGRDASAKLIIKSSIPELESIIISGSHSDNGRQFDSSLTADVGRHGQYSFDLDMTHDGSASYLSNRGKITIVTPIRRIDKVITAWSHRSSQNSIQSSLSCSWDNQKLSLKIDGSHHSSYNQRLVRGSVNIETPVPALREFELTLNHDHKVGELQSSASMVRNRYKRTEYAVSYTVDDDYNIESSAMFVCPGIKPVNTKLVTKLSDSPQTAEIEVEWSPSEKVSLSGDLTQYGWRYLDSTVRFTSPFRGIERIVFTGRHEKDDGEWVSSAGLEYAPRREISIRSRFSKESKLLGELVITFPFHQFQKLKVLALHSGDVEREINSRAQVELQPHLGIVEAIVNYQNGPEKKGSARVNTPFRAVPYSEVRATYKPGKAQVEVEYLPRQIITVETKYSLDNIRDLSGEVTVKTPISSFDFIKTSFLHRGTLQRSRSVVSVEYPRRSVFSATANLENDDKLEASLDLRAPQYDDVRLSVSHSGTPRDFSTRGEITYERYKKIEGDVSFSLKRGLKGPIVSLATAAKCPYSENFDLKLNHEGNIIDFKTNLVGSYGRANTLTYNLGFSSSARHLHADTDFDLQSARIMPRAASATFNLEGEKRNFKSNFEGNYQGKTLNTALSINTVGGIDSSFSLNTPFHVVRNVDATLKHSGTVRQFNSYAKLLYNRKEFEGDVSFTSGRQQIGAKLHAKTPFSGYRDLTSSFDFNGDIQKLSTSASIEIADGRTIQLAGNLDLLSRSRMFDLTIHTPFNEYETISAAGNFSGKPTRFDFNAHAQYATRSRIQVNGKFDMDSRRKVLEGTVLTPFYGYERLSVSADVDGVPSRFTSKANIEYGADRRIEASVSSRMEKDAKEISATVKTPFQNFRQTAVNGRIEGSLNDFSSSASVQYLEGQRISLSGSADLKRNPKTITLDLKTPFERFEEVTLLGSFDGYSRRFKTEGSVSLGRSKVAIDADVNLEGSKKKISATITSPIEGYEHLSIDGNYQARPNRHEGEVVLEYAPNRKIEVDAGLTLQRDRKNVRMVIKTPFEGYERVSAKGNLNGDLDKFNSEAELEYATNEKIEVGGSLDLLSSPKSVSISLKTPLRGLRDQSLFASVSGEVKRCEVDARVTYGDRKTITLNGALDVISSPITINGRITTPYPGFEKQAFGITTAGEPLNFQSSVTVESSQLRKPILARVSFAYKTPTNVDAVLTFTSAIPNAETLKLVIKNKNQEKYTSHIEAKWAPRKAIELDASFDRNRVWSRTNTAGELSISTPFKELPKAGVRFEDNIRRNRRNVETTIEYDSRNIVTLKANRVVDGENSIDVNILRPRPMKLQASGTVNSDTALGTVFVDWDSRDPESNVKLTASYNDGRDAYANKKDVTINIINPKHSVGFIGKLEHSPQRYVSNGEVTWNNRKVSIDSEFTDRSHGYTKMYNGRIKLNTPYRSLKLEGSHSDDVIKIKDEIAASWDAERDESKKILLSSEVQRLGENNLKTDFKAELPSIGKELRVITEASINRGRTLFDGKSEVSYSSDRRKTLTISSKIEDTSRGNEDAANYTVALSLRHPSTNTDIRVVSHAGTSEGRLSAAAEVNYLSSRRQRENVQLRGEIDKLRKRMNLEVVSPIKSVEITGKLRTDSGYHLSLHNVYDKSKSIETNIAVDPEKGNIELSMGSDLHNPRNTVNLRAGYMDDKIFSVEAFHVSRQGRVSDGLIALTLNTSRILHTRLHWRPSVIRDIKDELNRRSEIYQEKISSSLREVVRDLAQEIDNRQRLIAREIRADIDPALELLSKEWNAIDIELARIMETLNELGLEESLAVIQKAMDTIMKFADETLSEMSKSYDEAAEKIKEIWENVNLGSVRYEEIIQTSVELLKEYYVEAEQFVEEVVRTIAEEIERLAQSAAYHYSQAESKYRIAIRSVRRYSSDLADRLLHHPKLQELKRQYSDIISRIPDLPNSDSIKAVSRKLQDTMKSYSRSVGDKYIAVVEKARQKITETVKDVLKREEVQRIHAAANEIYQQSKWAYNYWEIEKNVAELARSLVKNIRGLVSVEIKEIRDSILNLDKSRIIVYDPQHGEIQFEIFLPVALKSLRSIPDASVQKYVRIYKKFGNSYIPSRNFSIYDTYYSYKPSTEVRNWVPPFKAHASISGKHHFTTFDGRHFDFGGLCSYILAHDFMDGNFSVILNYDGDWVNFRKRSLTITTGTKNIDIFPDYKIQVDGRPQELPYVYESTTVKRDGSVIRVDSGNGVEVECDLAHDIYTVTISGWYFGKTAGLFGTYDNEPSNDIVTSSSERTENIQEFANSWEVAGSCRSSRNFVKPVLIRADQPGFETCRRLFRDDSSPYRHCFKQVDPMVSMAKCMEDHLVEMSEWSPCNATAQYIHECSLEGVSFTMPPECVRCEAPKGGVYRSGEDLILSEEGLRAPRSADVVFVIEEKECNKDAAEELQTLARSVESGLRNNGLVGNRFGIVGYGGPQACDNFHTHTIDGEIMNDARRFGVGVESLRFDKPGQNTNVLGAVMFAAKYPFRTGVSKSIVLMPCSSCDDTETSYEDLEKLLVDRGIHLHLFMKHDFAFRSNKSPKSTNVFGIDKDGAYAFRRKKGDSKLLGELRVPKDNCVALSQNTKGTMFNLARLTEGHQNMQKSFRDVWSRQIAQSADPMSCQKCECVPDENGVGVSVCTRCDKSTIYESSIQALMPNTRQETRPELPGAQDDFDGQLKGYLNVYRQ